MHAACVIFVEHASKVSVNNAHTTFPRFTACCTQHALQGSGADRTNGSIHVRRSQAPPHASLHAARFMHIAGE